MDFTIPGIIFLLSKGMAVISLGLLLYCAASFIKAALSNGGMIISVSRYQECIAASKSARNACLVLLAVIFFVASSEASIAGLTPVEAVVDIATLYCQGSGLAMLAAFAATIVFAFGNSRGGDVKALLASLRFHAIAGFIVSFAIAFLLS